MSEDIYCGSTINFSYTQRPQKPQLPIIFLGVNNYLPGRPWAIFTIYDGPKYHFLFSLFHCKILFYPEYGSLIVWWSYYIWVFVRMKSIKHHQKLYIPFPFLIMQPLILSPFVTCVWIFKMLYSSVRLKHLQTYHN